MDHVEVIAEKEQYARDGVHKGMQGWITEPENINGYWLVNFPQCGEKNDIATIPIKEEDMNVVMLLDARINERIKVQFEKDADQTKLFAEKPNDISDYRI